MENISKKKTPCIIASDINIDFVKYGAHRETTDYINNLLVNNFIPMIIMPSRVTANSATIIDHIYYYEGSNSKKNQNVFTGNLWSELTDHLPNYLLITDKHSKADAKRPKVRLFADKNAISFKTQLSTTNWEPVFDCDSVNDGYHYFENRLKESYNSSFNFVQLSRQRAKDKIWMTAGLKRTSRHKNRPYRKWRTTRSSKDAENYNNYRRHYKQVIRAAEKSYFKDQFDTKTNTVKQLWSNLASFASLSKKKNKNNVLKLKENGKYLTDPSDLSDTFNKYFCTVGNNLQRQIKHDNMSFESFLPNPTRDSMFCLPVNDIEIYQIINRFNNKKSPGPDNIGPRLLKEIATKIVEPLVYLCNCLFLLV